MDRPINMLVRNDLRLIILTLVHLRVGMASCESDMAYRPK